MKFKIHALSIYEKGHYREGQEDNIFPSHGMATDADRLFMVCDGMGGHDAGEVASQAVCEAMSSSIMAATAHGEPFTDDVLNQALSQAFDLLDQRDPNPESTKKMGTTMTLVKFHADGVTMAHIGDSRIYQFRPDANGNMGIVYKSEDHSLVNDLLRVGELTSEEAKTFPRKNVITRAMQANMERRSRADIRHTTDVQAGDYFYMCSDGMLENVTDENLCFMIGRERATDEDKLQMLRGNADENRDNHSAYLIHVLDVESDFISQPTVKVQQTSDVPSPVQNAITEKPATQAVKPLTQAPLRKPRQNLIWIILPVIAAIAACLWLMNRKKASEPEEINTPIKTETEVKQQPAERHVKPLGGESRPQQTKPSRVEKPERQAPEGKTEKPTQAESSEKPIPAGEKPASEKPNSDSQSNNATRFASAINDKDNAEAVSDDEASKIPTNAEVESDEERVIHQVTGKEDGDSRE